MLIPRKKVDTAYSKIQLTQIVFAGCKVKKKRGNLLIADLELRKDTSPIFLYHRTLTRTRYRRRIFVEMRSEDCRFR